MPKLNDSIGSYIVNKVALGGINSFDDPKDISDVECTDILNMVFDNGTIFPRQGSYPYLSKPTGETADPFQMIVPTDSNGIDYMIMNYGVNFYLADTVNTQWIKINQIYTPPTSGIYYGFANWNSGIIDDRMYLGNGTDDMMKWIMAINQLAVEGASAATTITLNDAIKFPTSIEVSGNVLISLANPAVVTQVDHQLNAGDAIQFQTSDTLPASIIAGTAYYVLAAGLTADTFTFSATPGGVAVDTSADSQSGIHSLFTTTIPIIVKGSSGEFIKYYSSKTGNVLNLTSAIGQIVPVGSSVTMPLRDMSSMPKGKVSIKFQNRLVTANSYTAENTLNYSYINDPEKYVQDSTPASAGFEVIFRGSGGIINMDDFGEYLVIEKQDIILQFFFNYATDNSGFIVQFTPIISGDSIGPVTNSNSVNYMNKIYYTTSVEGIVSFTPSITGGETTSTLKILSDKIQNYVTKILDFQFGRTAGWNQKLFWLNAVPLIQGLEPTANNGVLMYDLIREVWTRFDTWNAADIKPVNNLLYYVSVDDGGVHQCFVDYQDSIAGNPYGYTASFSTKRFDLNSPQLLSRPCYVYLQGYINRVTKFYVDVLYNENGYMGKQTYLIDGSNSTYVQNNLLGGLAAYPFAIPLLGGFNIGTMQKEQQPAFFRVYLELQQGFRPNNVQIVCYSLDMGSYWGVNNITLMPLPEASIPTQLVISPTTEPPIVL